MHRSPGSKSNANMRLQLRVPLPTKAPLHYSNFAAIAVHLNLKTSSTNDAHSASNVCTAAEIARKWTGGRATRPNARRLQPKLSDRILPAI